MKKTVLLTIIAIIGLSGCEKKESNQEALIDAISKLAPVDGFQEEMLLPSEEAIIKECEEILSRLQNEGVASAFNKIRELSPLSDEELSVQERKTKEQLDALKPRFGKIIGYEKVRIEKKSDSVISCTYISKCDMHILRWRFYFYKPTDKWFLNSFLWDDRIHEL